MFHNKTPFASRPHFASLGEMRIYLQSALGVPALPIDSASAEAAAKIELFLWLWSNQPKVHLLQTISASICCMIQEGYMKLHRRGKPKAYASVTLDQFDKLRAIVAKQWPFDNDEMLRVALNLCGLYVQADPETSETRFSQSPRGEGFADTFAITFDDVCLHQGWLDLKRLVPRKFH